MDVIESKVSDLTHAEYLEHQWCEVSDTQIQKRAGIAKPAGQFKLQHGKWVANSYEGFAIVSMVDNNRPETGLPDNLADIQNDLRERLIDEAYYFLPQTSFHQTIANTLSNSRYIKNIKEPGVETVYPKLIQNAFTDVGDVSGGPVAMKLIGLSIFSNAIGILGIIDDETDYHRLCTFRSRFYADDALSALDVRMTRPFIGHITLAYIERELTTAEKQSLSVAVCDLNRSISKTDLTFEIERAELRRYHHLAEFIMEDEYPTFYFNH